MAAMKTEASVIDLTTTVRFASVDADSVLGISEQLDAALRIEIDAQGAGAVREYFVRPVGATVQVGLRFVGMEPQHVEDTADELLQAALEAVMKAHTSDTARGKRTSTLLVGA
ncbi:hypothetical protein [Microbacterium maritypicum]|uniref:Uncharacterized protein n=2 Tax=Microbacterium maritypicum TaxID=33918 RepID=A0ACD4B6K1_MICMQ|nr:hypothetical protein [Microbacterium liquefaciens]MBP5802934.1 hypothetical protein [Microbacterium liquefaciens]UTT53119.1 hypothetical protein NMQ05_00660 [Microbacterium liquefaciens]WEF21212.1 hypothetical protein PWF71_00670 [Microbacterium liquefaciens]